MKFSSLSVLLLLVSMSVGSYSLQIAKVGMSLRTGPVQAQDTDWWPMFHHDMFHSGYSASTAPNTNHTTWTYENSRELYSSPAVVDGIVYVGSLDHRVYALNAVTSTQIWNYTTGFEVWSSPTVADGKVYIGSGDGNIYALNSTTGAYIWSYGTGRAEYSSPTVADGRVYVGSQDFNVYCLNASTGEVMWTFYLGLGVVDASPAVADGRVYVGCDYDNFFCLNATTGTRIWNYTMGTSVWSSPSVTNGVVYVGSGDDNVYALNAATGAVVWKYKTGNSVWSSPAVVGGVVYVGSMDDKVYALNAATGALVWDYTTGDGVWSSPAVADGKVYVGSCDCKVYCMSALTGAGIWDYTTGHLVESSPAVANGSVYVGSFDGKVYAFGSGPYDVTIKAHCNSEGLDVGIGITMDGSPTGYLTPHTFTGLTGTHTFKVADTDVGGHVFTQWDTGSASTTITLMSGETHTAYYQAQYFLVITTTAGGITIPSAGTYTYWDGATVSVRATPETVYTFDHWELDGVNVGSTNPTSVTMNTNHRLYAVFLAGYWWPMFHHDLDHSGYSTSTAPNTNQTLWNYTIGAVFSSPSVVNGVVYVGSLDNNVYALNAATGTLIWNYSTGGQMASSPAVVGGIVYIDSWYPDNSTYALNATTGALIWKYSAGAPMSPSPAVANDIVYVGSDNGNVYALNAITGALVWKYTTGAWVFISSPAVANGIVYVGSMDYNVYALNAATGTLIWSYKTDAWVESSPAVVNGIVYVGSMDGNVYALDARTGALVWKHTTGSGVFSSPAVAGGVVYVGSTEYNVYALNAATGTLIWNYSTGGEVYSSPAVAGGVVYVGSTWIFWPSGGVWKGDVWALNSTTGTPLWKYTTDGELYCSPAVADGVVYVGNDGKLYALGCPSSTRLVTSVENKSIIVEGNVTITSALATKNAFSFNASGSASLGHTGWINVAFPMINTTQITVFVDGSPLKPPPFPMITTNGTYYFIYFELSLSTHEIAIQFGPPDDIVVIKVTSSKTVVCQGYSVTINVTAADLGGYTETFNITVYANAAVIGTRQITLASGNSTTITFTWDTRGFTKGSYTLSAYASLVHDETYTANNLYVDGTVQIYVAHGGLGRQALMM